MRGWHAGVGDRPWRVGVARQKVNQSVLQRLAERVGLAGLPAGMLTRLVLVAVQGIEELGQRPPGVAGLTVGHLVSLMSWCSR